MRVVCCLFVLILQWNLLLYYTLGIWRWDRVHAELSEVVVVLVLGGVGQNVRGGARVLSWDLKTLWCLAIWQVLVSTWHRSRLDCIKSIRSIKRYHSSVVNLLLLEASLGLVTTHWDCLTGRSWRCECLVVNCYRLRRSDLTDSWSVEFAIHIDFMLRRLSYVVIVERNSTCLIDWSPIALLRLLALTNIAVTIPCLPEVL